MSAASNEALGVETAAVHAGAEADVHAAVAALAAPSLVAPSNTAASNTAPMNTAPMNTASLNTAPTPSCSTTACTAARDTPHVSTWRLPAPTRDAAARARRRARRRRHVRAGFVLATTAKLGALLFVTYGLIFNFSVVRGSSMAPGIHDGDRILVDHLSYVFSDVDRGDIIVLRYPLDPQFDYIKRVVGLPGDDVLIRAGRVWVNGIELEEPYVDEQDARGAIHQRVERDSYFVLGDNRPHSSDSREFGQVPREYVVGKVDVRVWPPARLGLLD